MVEGEQVTVTVVMVPEGLTVTVNVPNFEVSCVEVAVIVTGVLEGTTGALNKPTVVIVPALAAQVTAELNPPVPVTVAVH